jgi:putative DNA primase/helicase
MHRNNRGGSNDLAALRGSRMVKISELNDGDRVDEAIIKSLTGGDRITCRFLYGEYFQYTPSFKIVMLGNHKPKIRGRDLGIWRRIHLLPFSVTIPEQDRDPDLLSKLLAELPGILTWAVRGCLEWQRIGLQPPNTVLAEVEAYRKREDIFSQWIDECCVSGNELTTPAKELMESFVEFSNWRNISPQKFGRMLAEAGFIREKVGTISWKGISLNSGQYGRLDNFCVNTHEKKLQGRFTESSFNRPDHPKAEQRLPTIDGLHVEVLR